MPAMQLRRDTLAIRRRWLCTPLAVAGIAIATKTATCTAAHAQKAAWRVKCTGDGKVLDCRAMQQLFQRIPNQGDRLLIAALVRRPPTPRPRNDAAASARPQPDRGRSDQGRRLSGRAPADPDLHQYRLLRVDSLQRTSLYCAAPGTREPTPTASSPSDCPARCRPAARPTAPSRGRCRRNSSRASSCDRCRGCRDRRAG